MRDGPPPPAVSQQPQSPPARLSIPWAALNPLEGGPPRRLQVLSAQELYTRICVRAPYFALREVTVVGEGEVLARVPVEQEPGGEASPINAAETGRHLAIVGSCAASLVAPREGQHYYLARHARLERLHEEPLPRATGLLWAAARAEFTGRRGATARTVLASEEGRPLFSVEVDYDVLSAATFVRLFQDARQGQRPEGEALGDFTPGRENPHGRPLPLREEVREGACLRATLGPVPAELCRGHFVQHPVLPVARVMGGLSGLAGTLLRQLLGEPEARYLVTRGEVRARSFAQAGETVTFGAHRHGVDGLEHHFSCWAAVGERLVGEMDLGLTLLP